MFASENPKQGQFIRAGKDKPISEAERRALWEQVLEGDAKREMMAPYMPPQAVLDRLAQLEKYSKPVFKRGPG